MTIGYDRPLYILPFDHRGTFQKNMFGWKGTLTAEQTAEIAAAKQVIYDGFKAAFAGGVPQEKAGILVDEQFGAAILHDAAKHGYSPPAPPRRAARTSSTSSTATTSPSTSRRSSPTFCKVLVRYNPEGDAALNQRQAARLKRLSDYLHSDRSLFMFELLVPASRRSSTSSRATRRTTIASSGPSLMVRAIHELQDAGIEADVWKIEGLDRREDCAKVVAAARRGGRDRSAASSWAAARTT